MFIFLSAHTLMLCHFPQMVLLECYYYKSASKQTKVKDCPFFFCHRTFPSSKPFLCWKGCWEMQIPPNQPGFARKWQTLRFSAGSVWGCSSSGESHSPGENRSYRFNCSFSVPQPHQPWWPQVSTHRMSTGAAIISICPFVEQLCFCSFLLTNHWCMLHQLKALMSTDSASVNTFLYKYFRQNMDGCECIIALCIICNGKLRNYRKWLPKRAFIQLSFTCRWVLFMHVVF